MIRGYFVCLFMGFILPVKLDKYDLIVIPISKRPVIINNLIQIPIARTKDRNNFNKKNKFLRIDIENYEEPTETPDLDSFDYMQERESFWSSKEESKKRNFNTGDFDRNRDRNFNDQSYNRYDQYRHRDDENNYGNKRAEETEVDERHTADFYDTEMNYADDKIVGGREVDINLYPYHVAYGSNCGGAIIDKNWVVTAGHCGKKPYVRVGSKYLNQGTKIMIKRSVIHPNWAIKTKEHPFDYDFQLLETAEPIKFNENTQPIKLAHIEDMVIGKIITVTGWGNTEENGPYSSVLRAVRVPIISKENCQNVPFPYFRGSLTARMFCAGFDEGKKDACQGDSGGPAVAYDRLLGMVSFGYGCATPGSYGVYSKVAKVRPWIEQVTGLKLD